MKTIILSAPQDSLMFEVVSYIMEDGRFEHLYNSAPNRVVGENEGDLCVSGSLELVQKWLLDVYKHFPEMEEEYKTIIIELSLKDKVVFNNLYCCNNDNNLYNMCIRLNRG